MEKKKTYISGLTDHDLEFLGLKLYQVFGRDVNDIGIAKRNENSLIVRGQSIGGKALVKAQFNNYGLVECLKNPKAKFDGNLEEELNFVFVDFMVERYSTKYLDEYVENNPESVLLAN